MRTVSAFICCVVLGLSAAAATPASAIEAVRGKEYKLTPKHGPWMIMVASFRDVKDDQRKEKGLSAAEAAAELVYELRTNGIPAYTFAQDGKVEKIDTIDRLNRPDQRIYAAQRDMICVLAGNYELSTSNLTGESGKVGGKLTEKDDKIAEDTLRYVKAYFPKFMKEEKSGAIFRLTPGRKGPLSGAFLTINPLLKPTDVVQRKADPEVLALNSGIDNALVSLKKPYTVKVATFSGRSVTPLGNSMFAGNIERFDQKLAKPSDADSYDLNRAGEDATQLAHALRARQFEAYVYHDRFQSIVTVGGFDSPDDPRIRQIVANLGAKAKEDPATGKEGMVAEILTLKLADGRQQAWIFDPQPQLIATPRVK